MLIALVAVGIALSAAHHADSVSDLHHNDSSCQICTAFRDTVGSGFGFVALIAAILFIINVAQKIPFFHPRPVLAWTGHNFESFLDSTSQHQLINIVISDYECR